MLETDGVALPDTGVDEVLAVDAVEALPATGLVGERGVVTKALALSFPSCLVVRTEVDVARGEFGTGCGFMTKDALRLPMAWLLLPELRSDIVASDELVARGNAGTREDIRGLAGARLFAGLPCPGLVGEAAEPGELAGTGADGVGGVAGGVLLGEPEGLSERFASLAVLVGGMDMVSSSVSGGISNRTDRCSADVGAWVTVMPTRFCPADVSRNPGCLFSDCPAGA